MSTIARADDPRTSHQAADEITNDGTRSDMMQKTRELLRAMPGRTANELEAAGHFKDGQIRKRLHDLFQSGEAVQGEIRNSEITGKANITWWATQDAPDGCKRFEKSKTVTVTHQRGNRVVYQFKATAETNGRVTTITFPTHLSVFKGDEVHIT